MLDMVQYTGLRFCNETTHPGKTYVRLLSKVVQENIMPYVKHSIL